MLRNSCPVQTSVTVLKHNNHIHSLNPRDRIEQVPCGSTSSRLSCGIHCLLHLNELTCCRWTAPSQKYYDKYIYIGHGEKYSGIRISSLPPAYGCIPLQTLLAYVNKTKSYLYKHPRGLVGQKTGSENRVSRWWRSVRKPGSKLFLTLATVRSLVSFVTQ